MPKAFGDKDYANLARGVDKFNNFNDYPPPTQYFAPENLDVYVIASTLQTKVMMAGADNNNAKYKKT